MVNDLRSKTGRKPDGRRSPATRQADVAEPGPTELLGGLQSGTAEWEEAGLRERAFALGSRVWEPSILGRPPRWTPQEVNAERRGPGHPWSVNRRIAGVTS
jgi:hypothetical protein